MNKHPRISNLLALLLMMNFMLFSITISIKADESFNIHNTTEHPEIFQELSEISPGDIINTSFSDRHPSLGKPVGIKITVKGNPAGQRFEETLEISDEYEGLIFGSGYVEWKSGKVTIGQVVFNIGNSPIYTKKISWYPVIVGNHTLKFKMGSSIEKIENISVDFDIQNVIYPSLGCPEIVDKNSSKLVVAVSERRHLFEPPISIQNVELDSVDGSATYIIFNETTVLSKWVNVGKDTVEEELVVSYNVSSVPSGFYNISVTTMHNTYCWPHALKIIDNEAKEYTFVQITDPHIGKLYNSINEKKQLENRIQYINDKIKPEFVILSGDSVDWSNVRSGHNFWMDLQEVLLKCNSPVFTVPGNHERYTNGLRLFYMPFTNLSYYSRFLNPLNNYAFEYGDIQFILLDSGYDWSRWDLTPEASGLTNTQMYLLKDEWGNNKTKQVIVMHHPAVNKRDDRGLFYVPDYLPSGNDQCISFNRMEFIDYCTENNVTLVLSGHTHKNAVFDPDGNEPPPSYKGPLFIQTDSATLDKSHAGGRIITVINGTIQSYDYSIMLC